MGDNDYKLLAVLQQNAKTSIQDMAEHIGASTASVQRRLKTLRDTGVIKKEVAVLDPKNWALG